MHRHLFFQYHVDASFDKYADLFVDVDNLDFVLFYKNRLLFGDGDSLLKMNGVVDLIFHEYWHFDVSGRRPEVLDYILYVQRFALGLHHGDQSFI
jgi:hypothetical protein